MAKIGEVFCLKCGRPVRCDTPQSAAEALAALPAGTRIHDRVPVPTRRGDIEQLAAGVARGRICPGDHRRAAGKSG